MNNRFLKSIGFWGKVFSITILIVIGWLIWSRFGTSQFALFLIIGVGIIFLEIRRQAIIDKVLKEILRQNGLELKEKIPQLEAKRSIITAIFYLIKKMGLGKESVPKFAAVQELADLGTDWIKKHLGRMMNLHEILNPILLNSFLPPIKAVIHHNIQEKKIFLGASIGCGLARFEEKIIRYCNKKGLPSIIFAVDINKDLILNAKKRMEKKGIMTSFQEQSNDHKINLQSLIDKVLESRRPLVCFLPVRVENFPNLFQAGIKLDLIWFLHSREHTIEENPEVFQQIKQQTKEWIILETFRHWGVIFLGNLINWWLSPLFTTETEISITRNFTPKEWAKRKWGVVMKRFPYFCWVLSEGAYKILKKSRFWGRCFGKKDRLVSMPSKF